MNASWVDRLRDLLRTHAQVIVVTLIEVRGHAPQSIGAKMLVTAEECYGTVGGGNLEKLAETEARKMLARGEKSARTITIRLGSEKGEWGAQCCGGEVAVFLEPASRKAPQVAIFGIGHVGRALAQVLSLLPVDLFLVDSRPEMLLPSRLPAFDAAANLHFCPGPIPEKWISSLSSGASVVILTHDHAEDLAILQAALARPDFRYIGLIGSEAKQARFRKQLREAGFGEAEWSRITTPIGIPGIGDKRPAAIAIATAAQILPLLSSPAPATEEPSPP
ncbi:MAG: xanthine dehydrogenase accessory protein XdhC [Methylacidiphilaceae bacterium]|nr:xanthine dehydrogenase accessory protein XdhC [Candidatus Methylacidiphilaceae bacterium]